MTVLLVDTDVSRLRSTASLLRRVEPDILIMSTVDPLTAAKYAVSNGVDMLVANLNMKRMSGLRLCDFVREIHPQASVCLLASREEFADCPEVFDSSVHPVPFPLSEEAVRQLI